MSTPTMDVPEAALRDLRISADIVVGSGKSSWSYPKRHWVTAAGHEQLRQLLDSGGLQEELELEEGVDWSIEEQQRRWVVIPQAVGCPSMRPDSHRWRSVLLELPEGRLYEIHEHCGLRHFEVSDGAVTWLRLEDDLGDDELLECVKMADQLDAEMEYCGYVHDDVVLVKLRFPMPEGEDVFETDRLVIELKRIMSQVDEAQPGWMAFAQHYGSCFAQTDPAKTAQRPEIALGDLGSELLRQAEEKMQLASLMISVGRAR